MHRVLRLAPFVALPLLLLARAAPADGQLAEKVQLAYELGKGTKECPGEGVLRHAILAEMKAAGVEVDPFSPTAAAKARVAVVRKGRMFQATYEILDAAGKPALAAEVVDDTSCTVVVEAAGMSVGLHLPPLITAPVPDADAGADAAGDAGTADAAPASAAAPATSATAATSGTGAKGSRPSSLAPIGGQFDIGGFASFETAPKPTGGFSLHGGLYWSFFMLSLGLRYEFPVSDGTSAIQASTGRFLIEAVPCLYWRYLYACGLAQVGERMVKWEGPGQAWHETYRSASLGGRLIFEWPFTSTFAVYVAGDVTGTMWYTALMAGDQRTGSSFYWRTRPLAGGGGGGLAVKF